MYRSKKRLRVFARQNKALLPTECYVKNEYAIMSRYNNKCLVSSQVSYEKNNLNSIVMIKRQKK